MSREGIARRIAEIRAQTGLSQRALATKISIAYRTWQDIENGKNVPSGETLLKIAELGFNPGWVLTGSGEMFADQAKAPPIAINADLMERLNDRVMSIYREAGQKPPSRRITREATNLYNELARLVPDLTDTEMIEAALPQLSLHFKRRIEQAAAEPGSGKHSA